MLEGFTRYNFKQLGGYVSCEPPEKVPMGSATVARNVKFLPNSVRMRDGLTQVFQLPEEFEPVLEITAPCPVDQPVIGAPYTYTFTAANGTLPYIWTIIAGALPTGLTLDPDTGTISGTVTTEGSYSYTLQVIDSSVPTRQVAQTTCVFVIAPVVTAMRPTIWEVDPATGGYESISIIYDGALAIDNDAPVGESTTYARLWGDDMSAFANYANEYLHGFPEPDPLRTLVNATIYVRGSRTCTGDGSPIAFAKIYNGKNTSDIYTGSIASLFDDFTDNIPLQNRSFTFTAATFAANFPGGASQIWIRIAQWHTVGSFLGFESNFLIYDCWIDYEYL